MLTMPSPGLSDASFDKLRLKYGCMDVSDTKCPLELQAENNKQKKLLVEAHRYIHALNTAFGVKRNKSKKSAAPPRRARLNRL